jgi:tRNA (cmo5U34)-methyltransferase
MMMEPEQNTSAGDWGTNASQLFIDYGRYFVPEREQQIETICDVMPPREGAFNILELCCGAGLLAGALLERFPSCTVYGYDGSPEMLDTARANLERYGERFQTLRFDLADGAWRKPGFSIHAVVSSLAIHHLDGEGKLQLFRDVYTTLESGGALVVADVIAPAHPLGAEAAAKAWDAAVRKRALEFDGSLTAFEAFEREKWNMYRYFDPDDIDKPSRLFDQLKWLEQAGFADVDVYWMLAGHAIFGGRKT